MTTQTAASNKYGQAISDLRRLVRVPFDSSPELLRFRHRVSNERARAHRQILERIAAEAHVNLEPILEDARRRNAAKRHLTTQILKKLEARAGEAANRENEHFHKIRSDYIKSFGGQIPLTAGVIELK